jgi:predicted RecA/RadA family phage recombinase
MAKNIVRYLHEWPAFPVACSHPATPASGDPVRFGEMTGVALVTEGDGGQAAATDTTVLFGGFVGTFSVKGVDGGGNSAVAAGDKLYYVDADTPVLSKKATGRFFGFANGAITSGSTATIEVIKPVNGA